MRVGVACLLQPGETLDLIYRQKYEKEKINIKTTEHTHLVNPSAAFIGIIGDTTVRVRIVNQIHILTGDVEIIKY